MCGLFAVNIAATEILTAQTPRVIPMPPRIHYILLHTTPAYKSEKSFNMNMHGSSLVVELIHATTKSLTTEVSEWMKATLQWSRRLCKKRKSTPPTHMYPDQPNTPLKTNQNPQQLISRSTYPLRSHHIRRW
jgi:hypothetical protein